MNTTPNRPNNPRQLNGQADPRRTGTAQSARPRSSSQPRPGTARQGAPAANTPYRVDNSAEFARKQMEYNQHRAQEAERQRRYIAMQRRREAERKRARKVFLGRLLVFLIIFLLLAVIGTAIFFIGFYHSNQEEEPTLMRYTYGGKDGGFLPAELAYSGGVLYVDFTTLADYLNMAYVGDAVQMRFVIPTGTEENDSAGTGDEEGVIFFAASDLAKVNGQSVRLTAESVLYNEHYLVPADFLTEYMTGITYVHTGTTAAISRTYTNDEPDLLAFVLKSTAVLDPIEEPDSSLTTDAPIPPDVSITLPNESDLQVSFLTDLSAYEQYMNPADRDAYLILVNNTTLIDQSYLPNDLTDLVDTRKDGRNTQQMRLTAAKSLEALYIEMRAAGYTDVSVTSAYRSYAYQSSLFNTYTANEMAKNPSLTLEEAQAITATYSARPGSSEHQTGLCCDMHNLPAADQAFANKEAFTWLQENAWKFGFILRFPEGKEELTGISFEPWHYRYVGRYHAKAIHDSGLCLEEYLAVLAWNQ